MTGENKKFITTVIIQFLINTSLVLGWFYIFSVINGKLNEISRIKTEIAESENNIKSYNLLKGRVAEIKLDYEKLSATFLTRENLIILIEDLEETAKLAGVSFTPINITADSSTKNFPNLKFDAKGSFSQVFRFISMVENMPYSLVINNAVLQKDSVSGEKSGQQWKINFNVSLISYEHN